MQDSAPLLALARTIVHRATRALVVSLPFVVVPITAQTAPKLPNVVIIYADDLGYGDLSCYNPAAGYQTPRLDRIAAQGVRFTDAHSPCTICSPSRYGLMSGNLVCRTGRRTTAFEGPSGPSYLAPGKPTIADMMREAGYRTAIFGKWHLGLTWFGKDGKRLGGGFENSYKIDYARSSPLLDGPQERGFDVSFITPNCPTTDPLYLYIENGHVVAPATRKHRRADLPNPGGKWRWDNDEGVMAEGYRFVDADVMFCDKALSFVSEHRREHAEQPFFLVLSTQIAHAPVLPAPGFDGVTKAGPRGDFVRELDTLAGRVFDRLEELGVGDDTLVLFTSDNGPETLHTMWMREDHEHDAAGGLRGMKRDGWEGGHRVPLIAHWPGHIPAGRVTTQLANTTDLYATLASLVGETLADDVAVDSFDLLPVLAGTRSDDDPVRSHMLTQSFRGEFQLRQGDWKLLAHKGSGGNNYSRGKIAGYALAEGAPEAPGQLYDLSSDHGEARNLWFEELQRAEGMQALLAECTDKQAGRTAPRGRTPLGLAGLPKRDDAAPPPNIVLIISDDHGFQDYGFMGSEAVSTPNLDQLAAQGLCYTRGYVMPVCSPSLATMLTGRYPHAHGITGNDLAGSARGRGPLKTRLLENPLLLPRALSDAGYRTMQTGKLWNATYKEVGFTHGMTSKGSRHGDRGLTIGRKGMQPIFEFIDAAVDAEQPFFVWYAPFLPHMPHDPSEQRLAKYRGKGPSEAGEKYHAMVEWLDDTVGELDGHLASRGLRDNTVVIYLADNGWEGAAARRSKRSKLTPYERGIRTPMLVRWPGRVAAERDEEHLASIVDIVPTVLAVAGLAVPGDLPGRNLLDRRSIVERDAVFVEAFTHDIIDLADPRKSVTAQVVIDGFYKLILPGKVRPKRRHAAAPTAPQLFDLRSDPLEENDLAVERPDVLKRLRTKQDAFWRVR